MTALDLLLSDGMRVLPILLASLVGSFIIFERLFAVRSLHREATDLILRLRTTEHPGDGAGVQSFLANTKGRAAAVFGHAIGRSDLGALDIVRLTESAWADEVDRMERPLTIGVLAALAAFLSGLLPFLVDLLELTREAGDPAGGVLLPSASAVVSSFVGCTVAGMLALGVFIARRELQKLRSSARTLVPELVQVLQDVRRGEERTLERSARSALSAVIPGEDEFFRPKAPAGIG